MQYLIYPLDELGFVNRFITTGVYCLPQQFEKRCLQGKVNEWLKKGFSIHENPCRKQFTEKRQNEVPAYLDLSAHGIGDTIAVFGKENALKVYAPFGNVGVEDSQFYYNPTYLRTYSYTLLYSEADCKVAFTLSTCGGATVWVNGQQNIDFTPFTRNMVKSTQIVLPLKKGLNNITVCLDDLAERDTDYYFRLQKTDAQPLRIYLPVADDVDIDAIYQCEAMLEDISFEKELYIDEPVTLMMKNQLGKAQNVDVCYKPVADKMENAASLMVKKSYALAADATQIKLLDAQTVIAGFYMFTVSLTQYGITQSRVIATQIFDKSLLHNPCATIQERKMRALKYLEQNEVDNVYKAAAIFQLDGDCKNAERIVQEELAAIRARKDCADFHLIIVLHIYKTFYARLSDTMREAIADTLLNFRYWIDEPGDDVMWFFSENHSLLFHSCQYFAGGLFPDKVFSNSGLTGAELREKAVGLLTHWFESYFEEFITEWNSNAYIPIDVIGLGTLFNLTREGEPFHEEAKKALDRIFYALAINEHKGAIMTTFGRCYEKEMKGNYDSGTTGILYIGYGVGYLNRASIAYISLILGNYEPPKAYEKYLSLQGKQELVYQNTQGFEQHVNTYMYKNAQVQLSSAIGFKAFRPGYQEHILQANIDLTAQVFVNHPGESQPYGNGRPSFWAGNGILPMAAQHRNVAILKFAVSPEHRIDYTHAYIPLSEFSGYLGEDNFIALEKDGGYIGVAAKNGLEIQKSGPCKFREFTSPGRENVWVVKVAGKQQFANLDDFHTYMSRVAIHCDENGDVRVNEADFGELVLRADNRFFVNGKAENQYPLTADGILEFKEEAGQ